MTNAQLLWRIRGIKQDEILKIKEITEEFILDKSRQDFMVKYSEKGVYQECWNKIPSKIQWTASLVFSSNPAAANTSLNKYKI